MLKLWELCGWYPRYRVTAGTLCTMELVLTHWACPFELIVRNR